MERAKVGLLEFCSAQRAFAFHSRDAIVDKDKPEGGLRLRRAAELVESAHVTLHGT